LSGRLVVVPLPDGVLLLVAVNVVRPRCAAGAPRWPLGRSSRSGS